MKPHRIQKLRRRREFVGGRFVVGVDPAKARHQAQVLAPDGLPLGTSFSFAASFDGFHHQLWERLAARLPRELAERPHAALLEHVAFAVEASCNLWPTLVGYLQGHGARVVLVSPLATCHARPAKSGDSSRTDPKDAFLVADLARQGTFHSVGAYAAEEQAAHRLAITYDKLRKGLQRHRARLRAQVEVVFPELARALKLSTLTARHLLGRYLTPEDFLALDLDREADREADRLMLVSREQHGRDTLLKLQALAERSVGVRLSPAERAAQRVTMDAHLTLVEATEREARRVAEGLIALTRRTPHHAPLVSLKGVSDLLAALLIAELRDPSRYPRPKQIERLAGYDLYVCDSGTYKGRRRISHLGNGRLRWVLYQMVSETSKHVPEVRAKYLRRRLAGHPNRQKNLVACIPQLLGLVVALLREGRPYEERPEAREEVRRLEAELEARPRGRAPRQSAGRGSAERGVGALARADATSTAAAPYSPPVP